MCRLYVPDLSGLSIVSLVTGLGLGIYWWEGPLACHCFHRCMFICWMTSPHWFPFMWMYKWRAWPLIPPHCCPPDSLISTLCSSLSACFSCWVTSRGVATKVYSYTCGRSQVEWTDRLVWMVYGALMEICFQGKVLFFLFVCFWGFCFCLFSYFCFPKSEGCVCVCVYRFKLSWTMEVDCLYWLRCD